MKNMECPVLEQALIPLWRHVSEHVLKQVRSLVRSPIVAQVPDLLLDHIRDISK